MSNTRCAVCGCDMEYLDLKSPWDLYEVSVGGLVFALCLCCVGEVAQKLLDKNPDFNMGALWLDNHCGISKIQE